MATNTRGSVGYKDYGDRVVIRGAYFTYADLADTSDTNSLTVCTIPAGAIVLDGYSEVLEGFNDSTGDDLHVGTSADPDLFDTSVDMNSIAHTQWNSIGATERYSTSDRTLTVNLESAATGDGTAGKVFVWVKYKVIREISGITQ